MSFLPSTQDGYLPYFLLFTVFLGFTHAIISYISAPDVATGQFRGPRAPPPTSLLAHVYGMKNFYTVLIRGYAAYHLDNKELYALTMWTFVGVLWLYVTEFVVWKTASFKNAMIPYLMAGTGLVWMWNQREWYAR
ncbi:ergosterol biosynthesis protein-like protein Erg28 [Cercophora newfieldiana]|uniref:Ergosterol biosynthesis protein-like protein Erg28 n=1 Tax=Cercophora newfieldiana TaxID=92897 RepID=A0AA40CV75_9PEZI|nr:ergosterol biosynthesis protein-like protein Erg28 [Cercophora newfieldiana]